VRSVGGILILIGVATVVIGGLVYIGALNWFGKLPGDIKYESPTVKVFIPFASMIIVSVVLSLLVYLFRKFFS